MVTKFIRNTHTKIKNAIFHTKIIKLHTIG